MNSRGGKSAYTPGDPRYGGLTGGGGPWIGQSTNKGPPARNESESSSYSKDSSKDSFKE